MTIAPAIDATTWPATPDGIAAALAALGNQPGTIADTLAARGIRGNKEHAHECPIANYLRLVIPEADEICVGLGGLSVDDIRVPYYDNEDLNATPTGLVHIGKFVSRFDEGAYPELVGG